MSNAFRYDKALTRCEFDAAAFQIDNEAPFDHEKELVVLVMLVPVGGEFI